MNHIAPPPEPLIREIPLNCLALAPENVRKTPANEFAEAELVASIKAHGLLENLVARADDPGPDGAARFAVVAGGRRLAALKALAENGTLDADHPVPCKIAANGNAGELSLAENVIRIAMHPADQVVAFSQLAQSGVSVAAIAARFGVTERLVEQRLRLGNAAPELLDAYRADAIDLETLKAFSVTTDHDRQRSEWEQISAQGYRPSAWQVKRMLTEERVPAGSPMARFVGVDAYEAAGGPVLRDLFADEHENGVWLEDPALLIELAMKKLQAAADELSTRWKWAEPMVDVDWSATARFGRIHPEAAEPTDVEKAEIEKLRTRHDDLANMDEDAWTDELVEEAEGIERRLDAIEAEIEARARFKPEDFAIAGCIATIGRDGTLQVIQGLVKPEDVQKPAEVADAGTGTQSANAGDADTGADAGRIAGPAMSTPMQLPKDREAEARKGAGVGIGLADDLRSIRTALVKAHLAGDFEVAFDLMLFQLVRAVFAQGYTGSWHALDIAFNETADRPTSRMNDDEFASWNPGEAMLVDWSVTCTMPSCRPSARCARMPSRAPMLRAGFTSMAASDPAAPTGRTISCVTCSPAPSPGVIAPKPPATPVPASRAIAVRHAAALLGEDDLTRLGAVLWRLEREWPVKVAAVRLILLTGCRSGEVRRLRWRDVMHDRLVLRDSKTGPRHVLLGGAARESLDRLSETAKGEWVFAGATAGRPLGEATLYLFWRRLRDEAGIVADARLHDLRHSHASHAIMNGETLHITGRLLGHRRAATTNRYAHLDDVTLSDAAERIAGEIKQKLSTVRLQMAITL